MSPDRAEVVIIGGGIIGCSIAYHLTRLGVSDVVLLERRQLSCGTTWHSVGSVGQLRGTRHMTELACYTTELFKSLEAETGQATGYKQYGSVMLGLDPERVIEMKRSVSMAKAFGLEGYDGIGKLRTMDQGKPVDASGKVVNTDVDGEFVGGVELAHKLASSALVRDCLATQWFRYGIGRAETKEDACAVDRAKKSLASTNGDMIELLVAITQSDTFRYRSEVKP